jgi:hypothetical protein
MQRQRSKSIEYVTKMIEILALDVDPDEIKQAVETLYSEGYYAKKRAS